MAALIVAQLFPLEPSLSSKLSYARLAKPLTVVIICEALVAVLFGATRFWRQQNAVVRGKVYTASWEPLGVGAIIGLVRIMTTPDLRLS